MRQPGEGPRSSIAFAIAAVLHVLAVLAVPEFRETVVNIVGSTADFVEVEAEPPPPPPPVEEPPPPPRVVDRSAPREPTEAPAPPQQTTTVPEPEVLAIDDATLSNFSVRQGTGPATAPIRSGVLGTTNTDGAANGIPDAGVPGGTGVVPQADLSVRPSIPSGLDDVLQRNYPADARQQAVESRAVVAFRVESDGTVGRIRLLRESVPGFGFGAACIRSVREGGRWGIPRDRDGQAVATDIPRFNCDFAINR